MEFLYQQFIREKHRHLQMKSPGSPGRENL
jgi:hypothetical protein